MTVAEWCVFGTLMLYLITIASVKWISFRQFDNSRPRDPGFYEDAIRARALGAHQNGIEAFPFFAVAVLLAEFRLGPQHLIDELAVLFLIVRIAYVFTYLGNRPTLRSILWSLGFAINIAIFFLPAIKGYLPGRDSHRANSLPDIASEAKQSIPRQREDRIASSLRCSQ